MPWLVNEDEALKNKLSNLKVWDSTSGPGGRSVTVTWAVPQTELQDKLFPYILLQHQGMSKADDREHRSGLFQLPYSPEGFDPLPDPGDQTTSPYYVESYPIPYDLDYRIQVNTRNSQHMMQIIAKLAQPDYLSTRYGYLEIPEDGTVRSLFVMGGPEYDQSEDNDDKNLFQATYLIRVATELLPDVYDELVKVLTVDVDLTQAGAYGDVYD